MKNKEKGFLKFSMLAVVFYSVVTNAQAEEFPIKPVQMIVPYAPGGSTDLAGRIVDKAMSEMMGQAVVVENRAGAAGAIGVSQVLRSTPDGYSTVLSGVSTTILHELLGRRLPYTAEKDINPVGYLGSSGMVDVLVNNAGASSNKIPVSELSVQDWDKVIDINLLSIFLVTQASLPLLRKSKNGRTIYISSTAERNGGAIGGSAYSEAKGAAVSFMKNLAKDFSDDGIHVNAVSPGLIDTAFYGDLNLKEKYPDRIKKIQLGRVGQPKYISGPVLFLASSLADYMTGEVIEVSGGLSLMG